jgi:Protein of unknown function (DUF2635)
MSKIYVIPSPGIRVPDPSVPKGTPSRQAMIPPEGKLVDESTYWIRREREGDVKITAAPSDSKTLSAGAKSVKAGE